MRGYLVVGIVAGLMAYGLGVRHAAGDHPKPPNCYIFETGGPGCSCSPSDCGDCIQGTPPTCSPAEHTVCYTTNSLTPVDPPGGYTRKQDSRPCGAIDYCFNPGGSECIGPCVDGAPKDPLPGTFNLYVPDAQCASPH
jgi:hypothetical protein